MPQAAVLLTLSFVLSLFLQSDFYSIFYYTEPADRRKEKNMKKRVLSLLLAVVFAASSFACVPLSAHADYADGQNCWACGHYHWDQYMCGICGACSSDCTDDDCFMETHCHECGGCIAETAGYCEECHWCSDCVNNLDEHCRECGACFVGNKEDLCEACLRCESCGGEVCDDCNMCEECVEEHRSHCKECGDCQSVTEFCTNGKHHCVDCHQQCEECGRCDIAAEDLEFCADCNLCMDCCRAIAEDEGCDCGEFCPQSSEYQEHFCENCGTCFDAVEQCESCGNCLDCCESASECSSGMCVEDPDYEEHFCEDCGDCFCDVNPCDTCVDEGNFRCRDCCAALVEFEGCHCGTGWCASDAKFQDHLAAVHSGQGSVHTGAVAQKRWSNNETKHWKECKYCNAAKHVTNSAAHSFNAEGICTVCAFNKGKPAYIIAQPKNVNCLTGDSDLENPKTYQKRVTVVAGGIGKLTYRWYYKPVGGTKSVNAESSSYYVSGANSETLRFWVPEDACRSGLSWYCVVKDSKGNSVTSATAVVNARHYWKYSNRSMENPPRNYRNKIELKNGKTYTERYSAGHKKVCCGCGEENTKAKIKPHSFSSGKFFGTDKYGIDWLKRTCTVCGYASYEQKHDHKFYGATGYDVVEAKTTAAAHALKCVRGNCEHIGYVPHTWAAQIVKMPGNKSGQNGGMGLDCLDCGYWNGNIEVKWTKDNYLVNAGTSGTVSKFVIGKSDTLLITPFMNNPLRKARLEVVEGKKITGWKATVRYSTAYGSDGMTTKEKTEDCTSKLSFNKKADGDWEVKFKSTVPSGSYIYFEAQYADCNHSGGTTLVDYKAAVCNQEGYTGDRVCKDCGKVVSTGVPISATGTTHTGTLSKIPGTETTGSCTVRGFEGYYLCSVCKTRVPGNSTGYKHGATTLKNYVAPTCTKEGYSGDEYCNSCKQLAKSGKVTMPAHNTALKNAKAATYFEPGYSGDEVCTVCGYMVKQGHTTPVKESVKLSKLELTITIPTRDTSAAASVPLAANSVVAGGKAQVMSSFWATSSNPVSKYTGTFTNNYYVATIKLRNLFSDYIITQNTKVYVNGTLCSLNSISGGYYVCYSFKPNLRVENISIKMDIPNEGESATGAPADYITSIPLSAQTTGSSWRDKAGNPFKRFVGGEQYTGWIGIAPVSGYGFSGASTNVYINGKKADTVIAAGNNLLVGVSVTATSNHSWDEGMVFKPASCQPGEKVYTCRNCGATREEAIPATATHAWKLESSENTHSTYRCSACGAKKTENNEFGDFYYSVDAEGVTIEKYYGSDTHIEIPAKVAGNPVVAIGNACFMSVADKADIAYIGIPDTVKRIGSSAFNGCASVKEFAISSKLEEIDNSAFYGCKGIKNFYFPCTLKSIGYSAFQNCTSLQSLQLPCQLKSIGNAAFRSCTSLTKAVIPDSVTSLEENTFIGCDNLETVVFGSGLSSLPSSVVGSCPKLKKAVIPVSVEVLRYHAFNHNDSFGTVYYRGTQNQWNAIENIDNPAVESAKKVFNYKTVFEPHHEFQYVKTVKPTAGKVGYKLSRCICGTQKQTDFKAPTGKVVTFKCTARTAAAQKVAWNKVATATGYQVQISNAAGNKWVLTRATTATSFVFKGLKAGNNYKFRVRFYIKAADGKNYFSAWSKTLNSPTLPKGTAITKIAGGKKCFAVQWSRTSVTGYQVQYSTNAKFTGAKVVTVRNAKAYKVLVSKLAAKRVYYVRARTYKTIQKANYFAPWSKAVKVKTK